MGPPASSRQAPTRILVMPLRPVGKSEACQAKSRSPVSGRSYPRVASSIISTTPSTSRSAGVRPPMSMPRRRAMEERTCSASSASPSISLDLSTSWVSVRSSASCLSGKPSASMRPSSRP